MILEGISLSERNWIAHEDRSHKEVEEEEAVVLDHKQWKVDNVPERGRKVFIC